jgi:hypothetical protein
LTFSRTAPVACTVFAVALVSAVSWPYTVDDAFIVARYATNLVAGHGYVFQPGAPVSDGVTGPLWLVPFVASAWAGLDPMWAGKLAGAACMAAAVALSVARLRRRAGGLLAAWSAVVLVSASPSFGTWGVAGLETGAAALLFVLASGAALDRPAPRAGLAGCAIGGLAWLRPEMALTCAALLACLLLRAPSKGRIAFGIAAAIAVALAAFRLGMFGAVLPLSFHAKPGPLAHGARYTLTGLVLATSVVGIALCALAARGGRADDRALLGVLGAHALALVLAGGDWMPGMRLWVPVLPAYVALAAVGVARLARRRRGRSLAALALLGACVVPAADLAVRVPELRAAGRSRDGAGVEVARWLRAHARRAALVDVGHLAYASGVEVVDLGGLTDASIARLPGGHLAKRIEEADLLAREPEAIVLHSATLPRVAADGGLIAFSGFPVEHRVAAMPRVRDAFRVARTVRYAPDYHYVLLSRRSR